MLNCCYTVAFSAFAHDASGAFSCSRSSTPPLGVYLADGKNGLRMSFPNVSGRRKIKRL